MERLERQQAQLELDALRDAKPVKAIPQHVPNVVLLLQSSRRRVIAPTQTAAGQVETVEPQPAGSYSSRLSIVVAVAWDPILELVV